MVQAFSSSANQKSIYFLKHKFQLLTKKEFTKANVNKQARIKIKLSKVVAALKNRYSHFHAWVSIKNQRAMQKNYNQQNFEVIRMENRQ